MVIAAFIILLALSVILGVFYTLAKSDKSWQSVLVKCLALLSCLTLSLVSANISSAYGAFTLMSTIAVACLLAFECAKCALENVTARLYLLSSANAVAIILFILASISLTTFSYWPILAGIFFGIGFGLLSKIIKKFSWPKTAMIMLNLAATFTFVMQSIALIITGRAAATAALALISALFMTAHIFMEIFKKDNKTFTVISNTLRILSIILIATSIYFI